MTLQLFLNELSVARGEQRREISIVYFKRLVALVREAHRVDPSLTLNTHVALTNFPLGGTDTVSSIRNSDDCVEESVFLKTLSNRAPMRLAADNGAEHDPDASEYRMLGDAVIHPGEIAAGLGFAHLLEGVSVSFPSHVFWSADHVELDRSVLATSGEIVSDRVRVRNADAIGTVARHVDEIRSLVGSRCQDGIELWERREEFFPNLIFIPRTRAQIQSLQSGDPVFRQLMLRLIGFEVSMKAWISANSQYPMFPFNVRPESRSRQLLAEFLDVDGVSRVFSYHCDLAPAEGRIHYIVKSEPRRHLAIGHVGRKLGIG